LEAIVPPALLEEPVIDPSGSVSPPHRRRRRHRLDPAAEGAQERGASQRLPALLVALAVVGSVLAIGSVHLPVLAVVAAVTATAAAIAVHRQAQTERGLVLPLPALVVAALAVYTLLQTIPMPMGWLAAIAPANADVWSRSLLPLGEAGPAWAPLSLDPGATRVEVLRWTTYGLVFVAAAAISSRHGTVWGVLTVFGAALLAALVTLGHGLLGLTSVYGLYKPHFSALAWHIGPLLNPNNLAGYLNLGALCGLGLLLSHKPPVPRWILGAGVALIVGIEVTSASRAGVLALPLGLVALAALRRRREDEAFSQSASTWLIVAAVSGGGLLAALGGSDKVWSELRDKNLSKFDMIAWVKPMIVEHPVFGIGRGAFESVFPALRTTPGNVVYTHAENFALQWATEWGLPVALAALVFFAWAFRPKRLDATKSALAAGAWAGVLALLAQNLLDLALEIPAVCLAASVVLGSLWGDRRIHGTRPGLRLGSLEERGAQLGAGATALTGVATLGLALGGGAHDVTSDRAKLHEAYDALRSARPDAAAPVRAQIRAAMRAHPAEPYFPLVGGMLAHRLRDQNAIPWIQRTLERGRINGRAHILLAEVLSARGSKRQALLELRLAVEHDPLVLAPASELAVRWAKTYDELIIAVPEGDAGGKTLGDLARLLATPSGDPVLRGLCDREAIRRQPDLVTPRVREARARLDAMESGAFASVCADRAHCRAEVVEHIEAILAAHPDESSGFELRASLLQVDGKPEEGVKLLEKACDRVANRAACLTARVQLASALKHPAALDSASKELLGASCVTNEACARTADWLAGLRLGRREVAQALALLSRAAREDGSSEARWLRLADVASQSGAHVQAADALEKVSKRRGGADPELRRRIDAERAQALGGLLQK
jgi:hypothetical protein